MLIILTSLVYAQNSKAFLLQSEASEDDWDKDKRIMFWLPFLNNYGLFSAFLQEGGGLKLIIK